jgi:hypothetical protein
MTSAKTFARRRAIIARSAANAKTKASPAASGRSYGIFRVLDGGAARNSGAASALSSEIRDRAERLERAMLAARSAGHLIEKYAGGAGMNHSSRKDDFALWTERQERWQAAADEFADYSSRNLREARFKAGMIDFDCNGVVALSIARDIWNLTGGAA